MAYRSGKTEPLYAELLIAHKRYLEAEARHRGISVVRALEEILDEHQKLRRHMLSISPVDPSSRLQ